MKLRYVVSGIPRSDRFGAIGERELMLYTAAFLWASTGIATFLAGVALPELAPQQNTWAWRVTFVALAAVATWSNLTWMSKLDDRHVYRWTMFFCVVAASMNSALMIANPLSIGALYVSMMAPAVFVGTFLRRNGAIFQIAALSILSIIPAIVGFDEVSYAHILSRVVGFLPILWSVTFVVYELNADRREEQRRAERIATTDPLTGVANVRGLEQRAGELLSDRNARSINTTALILIDLDNFKSANTLHGHAGGDSLLSMIGERLSGATSRNHFLARIGGDEFAVLIAEADPRDVLDIAIRYQNAVRSVRRGIDMPGVTIDASTGVASTDSGISTLEGLLSEADRSLSACKAERVRQTSDCQRPERGSKLPNQLTWTGNSPGSTNIHAPVESRPASASGTRLAWRNRPAYDRLAALTWAVGSSIGLLTLAMPDAYRDHGTEALVALLCGYFIAAIAYVSETSVGGIRHLVNDAFTLLSIAVITYLTGGAQSPLWPLVFLFIAFEAWFLTARQLYLRVGGPVLVILSPLIYQTPKEIGVATGAALYAGVVFAFGLTIIMAFHQRNREIAKARTHEMSTTDPRTGLSNRREFERRVGELIHGLETGDGESLAIVMIDLDNFKAVNTQHGHKAGDVLLQNIGQALGRCARDEDCIARVGGDEFAVAISDVDETTARSLSERFIAAVGDETAVSKLPACRSVSASAGFAIYAQHGRTLDELVNAADGALMAVKRTSKGSKRASIAA